MPDPSYGHRYYQFWAITASDSRPVQGPTQSDGLPLPYCAGFLALTSGNLSARGRDGHNLPAQTFPIIAGTVYDIGLSYVYTTSTATVMGLL